MTTEIRLIGVPMNVYLSLYTPLIFFHIGYVCINHLHFYHCNKECVNRCRYSLFLAAIMRHARRDRVFFFVVGVLAKECLHSKRRTPEVPLKVFSAQRLIMRREERREVRMKNDRVRAYKVTTVRITSWSSVFLPLRPGMRKSGHIVRAKVVGRMTV